MHAAITWHPATEPPQTLGIKIVTLSNPATGENTSTAMYLPSSKRWSSVGLLGKVIAWAELPQPFNPQPTA